MTVIKWRDAYNTGIDQFDQEHHKLVELISTMYGAVRDGLGKEVVIKACADLVAYTGYHFSTLQNIFLFFARKYSVKRYLYPLVGC